MMRICGICAIAIMTACGGDLDNAAVPDSAGGEVGTPFGSTAGVGGTEARIVAATLREWAIDFPSDTISAGRYTFRVQNSGQYQHALEVEGQGEEHETDRLAPAESDEITVELTPGTYELYCPVEDAHGKHKELGMRRTLVVR